MVAARTLRSLCPESKLLAFSVADTVEDVFSCAAAGFSGYVTREASVDELLGAVRAVCDGWMNCSPHIAAALFNQLADRLNPPNLANGSWPLTVRERQVLPQIEPRLYNSYQTYKAALRGYWKYARLNEDKAARAMPEDPVMQPALPR